MGLQVLPDGLEPGCRRLLASPAKAERQAAAEVCSAANVKWKNFNLPHVRSRYSFKLANDN